MLNLVLTALAALPTPQESISPIAAAVERADARLAEILAIPDEQRTFDNSVRAIDDLQASFFEEARMPGFLAQVSTDAAERDLGRQASAEFGQWFDELYQNEAVFEALEVVAARGPVPAGEGSRYLERLLRDYRRSGMDLPGEQRARLAEIDRKINELGIEFSQNIADDESVLLLEPEECAGVPEDFLDTLPQQAGLYVVELKGASTAPFWTRCEVESTRKKLSIAYGRRAGRKNVAVIENLIRLRAERARLLGYASTAEFETEIKMAKNSAAVTAFYDDLIPNLRRKAEADFAEYQEAKRAATNNPEAVLQPWDISFYGDLLKREKYAVDSEKVREYFPIGGVVDGIFELSQELFGLRFAEVTAEAEERGLPIWHEDVRLFEVWDRETGELLGEFYIDLHPRPGKFTHAAQFPLIGRKRWPDGSLTTPRVALVCNFTKPTETKPALLSHGEVETFFHEFGHCLHSILTEAEYLEFAGTAVARDFVEAPSQMLENWIWDSGVLSRFAKHYQTGETLPAEMLEGMIAARNLGSGLAAEGQVFLGLLDMTYFSEPTGELDTIAVREAVYARTRLFEPVKGSIGHASFGHLNGYHAGYYGYLWSLVYAQDMFSRFAEGGILNTELAREYRQKVLAKGGTADAIDLVRDFLGRDPNSKAFLEHLGLDH